MLCPVHWIISFEQMLKASVRGQQMKQRWMPVAINNWEYLWTVPYHVYWTTSFKQVFKAAIRGQQVEGKISNQHYLYSYLTNLRLKISIERNLLLIENLRQYLPDQQVEEGRKITKPQDLVRLYDIIIQVRNHASGPC